MTAPDDRHLSLDNPVMWSQPRVSAEPPAALLLNQIQRCGTQLGEMLQGMGRQGGGGGERIFS